MNETIFTKDTDAKTITVERTFSAPREKVWEAWTKSELLDQWWAPKPYQAVTKSFDFKEGGQWLYLMKSPDGQSDAWAKVAYKTIVPQMSFSGTDAFSDEQGNINTDLPSMEWHVTFTDGAEGTKVLTTITFASEEDMQTIVEMGFEEGYTMGLQNLGELLEKGV